MLFTPVYIHAGRAGALTGSHATPSARLGHSWPGTGSGLVRGQNPTPDRGLSPTRFVEGRSAGRKCEPVVGVRLHQHPIFSPALPPARGNERDVTGMALCPKLEVVAADERWVLAHSLQYDSISHCQDQA
jgi:hypothetical protein